MCMCLAPKQRLVSPKEVRQQQAKETVNKFSLSFLQPLCWKNSYLLGLLQVPVAGQAFHSLARTKLSFIRVMWGACFCSDIQVGLVSGGTSVFGSLLTKNYVERWIAMIAGLKEDLVFQLWNGVLGFSGETEPMGGIYRKKELAHTIMEVEKSHDLPSAS